MSDFFRKANTRQAAKNAPVTGLDCSEKFENSVLISLYKFFNFV